MVWFSCLKVMAETVEELDPLDEFVSILELHLSLEANSHLPSLIELLESSEDKESN